ncbi:MAG TPA: ABC transporter ATP-binding protein [Tepidisphaeraceae bacterium]|nr:ABC transporter ATP-binding protein [Tepidisphaeraceae bacterium]
MAISVRSLSKAYTIAHNIERCSTLAETLLARLKNPLARPTKETFYALKDVSLNVNKGEVVGIIGRNGAGKSTLLKILSRITEPTSGEIDVYGRIGSLLEVGTGFHPELTGRENIFLNGAILGMTKNEIRTHFDAIVEFAEVEKFIDTPVKRYSSGMYVRLAFAVAAHLNPEILIVDEVLAVGDANFQKKCLGKMKDVSRDEGRTVLFVSHNMGAIAQLCDTVLVMDKGRLIEVSNDVRGAIARYLARDSVTESSFEWRNPGGILDNPWFRPSRFYIGDERGRVVTTAVCNDADTYVYIEGEVDQEEIAIQVGYGAYDGDELLYWSTTTDVPESDWPRLSRGRHILRSAIPKRTLNEGRYRLDLMIALYHRSWISCPGAGVPSIELSIHGGLSDSPYWMDHRPGILAPVCKWSLESSTSIESEVVEARVASK